MEFGTGSIAIGPTCLICHYELFCSYWYLDKHALIGQLLMLTTCHTFPFCWPPWAIPALLYENYYWVALQPLSSSLLGLLCLGLSQKPVNPALSSDSAYWQAVCRVAGPYEPGVLAQQDLSVQILHRPFEVDVKETLSRLVHLSCWLLCAWVYKAEQKGWRSEWCLIALLMVVITEFSRRVERRDAKAMQGLNEMKTWKLVCTKHFCILHWCDETKSGLKGWKMPITNPWGISSQGL